MESKGTILIKKGTCKIQGDMENAIFLNEDAEYICKAVNNHKRLVDGLKLASKAIKLLDTADIYTGSPFSLEIENLLKEIEGQ